MNYRRVKQFFSRGGNQWEGEGKTEWVKDGEYGGCVLYLFMKIEQ
jgi:hypothetical protein